MDTMERWSSYHVLDKYNPEQFEILGQTGVDIGLIKVDQLMATELM